jgi:hypothetical protein
MMDGLVTGGLYSATPYVSIGAFSEAG